MALTGKQLVRLNELLDQALPMSIDQRRAWLETLPAADEPLRPTLNDALLSDAPAARAAELLSRPPSVGATLAFEHQVGERIGAYELVRPLGAGGMAEVWLARRADGAFERQVALKIPRLAQLPAGMAQRFTRECHILASLEFPGIARLYDAGVDERGVPYIAMEYVAGEPLTTWCRAYAVDVTARIAVFLKVLEVVERAHAQHVLHRDLKPSNILVTPDGDIRLLDFGIARLLEAEPAAASVTHAWGRALTPEYASPEMLRGGDVDARSDIYSLGVVLHELLTGGRPGDAAGQKTKMSDALHAVVTRALSPSPADRFADAREFADAVRPFVSPAPKPARRYLLVAGMVAALLLAGLWMFNDRRQPPSKTATVPAREVSLAVLPFADLSAARDQAYLSEGIADEIINKLAQVSGLRTIGLRSTLVFRDRSEDLRVIGEKLGVENLLDGTIRKDGERLRILAQLLRARDGTSLWSKAYDRQLSNIFAVQDEIARDVATALSVKLDVGPMSRAQGGTTNLDAYDRYLKWRQMFLDEQHGLANHRRRVQLLREAVQFDSTFALAWGELPDELRLLKISLLQLSEQVGGSQVAALDEEAQRARARAVAAAPDSWIALRIRSEQLANEKRWSESLALARRILEEGPFTLERAYPYVNVAFAVGHLDDAIETVDRLIKVEPLAMYLSRDQQWNLSSARRYVEAEAEYRRSIDLQGSHDEADAVAFVRTLALKPGDQALLRRTYPGYGRWLTPSIQTWYPRLEPLLGDPPAMRALTRDVITERQRTFTNARFLADALGEPELAYVAMKALMEDPLMDYRRNWQLWNLPYSKVRALPAWKRKLVEAGILDYWRTSGKWGDFCKPVGADDFECR